MAVESSSSVSALMAIALGNQESLSEDMVAVLMYRMVDSIYNCP